MTWKTDYGGPRACPTGLHALGTKGLEFISSLLFYSENVVSA